MFTHPIRSFIIGINRNSRFLTAPNMVIKGCSQDSNLRNFEATTKLQPVVFTKRLT